MLIAGAGIVGLATAWQLKQVQPDLSIVVLDKEDSPGQHQTGHNSGVIHSGVYYKPGSLKAQNCTRGYELLLEFCRVNRVPHEVCGKVIVASNEEEYKSLKIIELRGIKNGLEGLELLDRKQLTDHEPNVVGHSGIYVPQAGIVDYSAMTTKLHQLLMEAGVHFHFREAVVGLKKTNGTMQVRSTREQLEANLFINCAGLYADKLAMLEGDDPGVRIIPFRGEYYKLKADHSNLVRNLIYPVPDPAFPFLGVHFTRMIGGGIECGPNAVLAYQREGYKKSDIDLKELGETLSWPGFQKVARKYWRTGLAELYRSYSKPEFTRALQKLVPAVQQHHLIPGGSGVRAQACDRHGNLLDDFYFHQTERSIHVLNAPSPAATSSLAIGETIAEMAVGRL